MICFATPCGTVQCGIMQYPIRERQRALIVRGNSNQEGREKRLPLHCWHHVGADSSLEVFSGNPYGYDGCRKYTLRPFLSVSLAPEETRTLLPRDIFDFLTGATQDKVSVTPVCRRSYKLAQSHPPPPPSYVYRSIHSVTPTATPDEAIPKMDRQGKIWANWAEGWPNSIQWSLWPSRLFRKGLTRAPPSSTCSLSNLPSSPVRSNEPKPRAGEGPGLGLG